MWSFTLCYCHARCILGDGTELGGEGRVVGITMVMMVVMITIKMVMRVVMMMMVITLLMMIMMVIRMTW